MTSDAGRAALRFPVAYTERPFKYLQHLILACARIKLTSDSGPYFVIMMCFSAPYVDNSLPVISHTAEVIP
jgi:hypothetical protein